MSLPHFLAKPVFHLLYLIHRRKEGVIIPPICRVVQPLQEEKRSAFDCLFDSILQCGPNTLTDYDLSYPKSEFLNYLCDWRGFVVHGSPLQDLEVLKPIRKSKGIDEFGNRRQIFSSPDAMWAMWFAILDKSKYDLTRNGCVRLGVGTGRVKYYHFELPKGNKANNPFTEGMIYITHAAAFPDKRPLPILDHLNAEIEEWGSTNPVTPLARIKVEPEDSPYLNEVQFNI